MAIADAIPTQARPLGPDKAATSVTPVIFYKSNNDKLLSLISAQTDLQSARFALSPILAMDKATRASYNRTFQMGKCAVCATPRQTGASIT